MKNIFDNPIFSLRRYLILKKIAHMGQGQYKPGNSSKKGYLYNPIPFPEFSDIPYQREACYERFELISHHLPAILQTPKTILDIGCHTGFNCFMLDRIGYSCTGLEIDALSVEIARDIASLYKLNINFLNQEAIPANLEKLGHFDVCLFLSTFQWVTFKHGYEFAKETLKQAMMSSDILFFETSIGNEGRAKMPMLSNLDDVTQLLTSLKVHKNILCLGEAAAPNQWLNKKRYIFKTER